MAAIICKNIYVENNLLGILVSPKSTNIFKSIIYPR